MATSLSSLYVNLCWTDVLWVGRNRLCTNCQQCHIKNKCKTRRSEQLSDFMLLSGVLVFTAHDLWLIKHNKA